MTKTKQKTKPRLGRRRWAALVKFLTDTMQDSSAKDTVRWQAAERLCEIALKREEHDIHELKAAARKAEAEARRAGAAAPKADEQPEQDEHAAKVNAIVAKFRGEADAKVTETARELYGNILRPVADATQQTRTLLADILNRKSADAAA